MLSGNIEKIKATTDEKELEVDVNALITQAYAEETVHMARNREIRELIESVAMEPKAKTRRTGGVDSTGLTRIQRKFVIGMYQKTASINQIPYWVCVILMTF